MRRAFPTYAILCLLTLLAGCSSRRVERDDVVQYIGPHCVGGFPAGGHARVLENEGYVVGYSDAVLGPLWAAYYCGPEGKFENGPRPQRFTADQRISPWSRLRHEDFNRPQSGPTYDRGHMAPNYAIATRYGRQAQLETFLLSNIVPQRSQLNQQTWADLEAFIANTLAPRLGGVWVLVGPVHGSERPRLNGKAVIPEAFYCIVVDQTPEGDLRAMAVIIGQEESGKLNLERFLATIREVERLTDLDFFPALPDDVEQQLETTRAEPDMCR